jgi:hypothetical protein
MNNGTSKQMGLRTVDDYIANTVGDLEVLYSGHPGLFLRQSVQSFQRVFNISSSGQSLQEPFWAWLSRDRDFNWRETDSPVPALSPWSQSRGLSALPP